MPTRISSRERAAPRARRLLTRIALSGILLLFLNVVPQPLPAETGRSVVSDLARASVRAWGPADGMLEEAIFSILESPDGFIWIATRDGLVRFDGENFQRIARGDKLDARDFAVGALAFTGNRIWLGARDAILAAKPDRFGSHIHVTFEVRRFARREDDRFGIASMQVTGDGVLMLRRTDGIFAVAAPSNDSAIPEPQLLAAPPPGTTIQAWTPSPGGTHWISTGDRVFRRRGDSWHPLEGSPANVTTLLTTRTGDLLMLGHEGLHRFRNGVVRRVDVPGLRPLEPGRAMLEDSSGAIWLGVTGGVARIHRDVVETRDLSGNIRPDDLVLAFYQGRDGAVWCGTRRGAVVRIEEPRFRVVDGRDGLGESAVSAVAQDGRGRRWIATRTRGVYLEERGKWRQIQGSDRSVFYALARTGQDRMLMASSLGLWISDGSSTRLLKSAPAPQTPTRYHTFSPVPDGPVDSIYYSDSARIWRLRIGANGEPGSVEPVTDYPLVRAILPLKDGLWLLGWEHGLARFAGGKLTRYGLGAGPVRRGMTLWEVDEKYLLAGTSEGGKLFHREQEVFPERPALFPEEHIFQVQEDRGGQLWLLARRALLRARREDFNAFVAGRASSVPATQYTPRLGLPSANFGLGTSATSMVDRDGELWLASLGGAIRVRPQDIVPHSNDIRCAILGLRANGAPVNLDGDLRLPAGTNRVQIQYTTAGPWIAENPVIHYQLEGSAVGKMDTGSNEAVYTNLGPGHFRFRIAATLPLQDQSGPETILEFDIEPYLHQRASFQILAGLAIGWTIVGGLWLRRRRSVLRTRELEVRVAERTAELNAARDEAERARVKAEDAARVKSEFLATMSHEIRTPMNGVIGMIQLLEATTLAKAQREQLDVIRSSGELLLTIVNDMLDLSKIETGSLHLENVDFSLPALLEDCVDLFRGQAAGRKLQLTLEVAPDCPVFVTGDPTRIRQIVLNLTGNSMKFTETGWVRIRAAREINPEGRHGGVRVSVRDTGIGIAEDKLAEIFKAFTQAESSTTRRYGGTGLGLTICDRLVGAMGGSITVTSTLGEGSEFTFVLPLAEAPEPGIAELAETRGAPEPGLRVLVVEDNVVNRRITEALLHKLGCAVTSVDDGAKAVEAATHHEFDAILMDCHMPRMDGYEAASRIRRLDGVAGSVPILALTASASPEDRERSRQAGMDGHISKPVTLEDLRTALSTIRPVARRGALAGEERAESGVAPSDDLVVREK
ncbi:MAG: response regulator [Bryobacterales bacterium]|nr:response regulator [Bryobacterales bacterium]